MDRYPNYRTAAVCRNRRSDCYHGIQRRIKKPLLTFSHQEGHIAAALFSAAREDLFEKEFLAFHISGGTTEAVLAKGSTSSFAVKEAAKTLDLNAGQAVDRGYRLK